MINLKNKFEALVWRRPSPKLALSEGGSRENMES